MVGAGVGRRQVGGQGGWNLTRRLVQGRLSPSSERVLVAGQGVGDDVFCRRYESQLEHALSRRWQEEQVTDAVHEQGVAGPAPAPYTDDAHVVTVQQYATSPPLRPPDEHGGGDGHQLEPGHGAFRRRRCRGRPRKAVPGVAVHGCAGGTRAVRVYSEAVSAGTLWQEGEWPVPTREELQPSL